MKISQPLRVGIGGPVGSGKTALTLSLCLALRDRLQLAVVTNDIYTEEDAQFLVRSQALPAERIIGVETGGCPHTAIREDASINLEAVERLANRFGDLDVVFVESGGDNLAATFSPELSDLTLYVIDVAAGDKIPRKGGPGITKSDLLVINKIDLAPHVGAVRLHQSQDRAGCGYRRQLCHGAWHAGLAAWGRQDRERMMNFAAQAPRRRDDHRKQRSSKIVHAPD